MPSRYHSDRSMILVSKNKIDRVANQPAPKYKWQCHQELHHMNSFNQTKCGWLNQDISSEFHHFDGSAIMSAKKKLDLYCQYVVLVFMTCNGWIFLWVRRGVVSSIYPTQIQHIPRNFQLKKVKKLIFFSDQTLYPLLMLMILYIFFFISLWVVYEVTLFFTIYIILQTLVPWFRFKG